MPSSLLYYQIIALLLTVHSATNLEKAVAATWLLCVWWDQRERRKGALCLYICQKDFGNKSHPQKLVWNSRGHRCTIFQRNASSCLERFIMEQWWPDWNRVPHAANTATKVCSELAFNSFSAFVLTQLVLSLHIYGIGNSVQKSRPFDSTAETVRKVRQGCGPGGHWMTPANMPITIFLPKNWDNYPPQIPFLSTKSFSALSEWNKKSLQTLAGYKHTV